MVTNLRLVGQHNAETFYDAVMRLKSRDDLSEKFIREQILLGVIEYAQPALDDKWMEAYLDLKHLANTVTKQGFITKLLSPINVPSERNMPSDHMKIFKVLAKLTSNDFTGTHVKDAYGSLKPLANHYAKTTERIMVVDIILKIYNNLDGHDKNEFATEIFAQLLTQISPQQMQQIITTIQNEKVKVFEFDQVVDQVFSILQNNPSRELMTLVYVSTPENKWTDLGDRIIQAHSADNAIQFFSAAFGSADHVPEELKAKIFAQILNSCKKFDHTRKLLIYKTLLESVEKLESHRTTNLADNLMSELLPTDGVQVDQCLSLIHTCFGNISEAKRQDVFMNILIKLEEYSSSNVRFATSLLEFLTSHNGDMSASTKNLFVDFLIKTLENEIPITVEILKRFNSIEFGHQEKYARDLVSKLCNSQNKLIKNISQGIMNGH